MTSRNSTWRISGAFGKSRSRNRLRTDRVGLLLSGGLDSSSLAAVEAPTVPAQTATQVYGDSLFTSQHVFESLIPDREGDYCTRSGGVPAAAGQAHGRGYITQLFEGWDDPDFSLPEPVEDPLFAGFLESCRNISADCRVLFIREGVDNLMSFQMWPYAE